jgi:predicted HAD superfamily Cof-like phosphohydrolase
MSIESIALWHKRARPTPTSEQADVQLGCHFEEIVEMFDNILIDTFDSLEMHNAFVDAHTGLKTLSEALKTGRITFDMAHNKDFLDSLADQIVTAVGVGHCCGLDIAEAVSRVNTSNWSKFDQDGQPIFDSHGKIVKGLNYAPPDLEGLY